MMQLKLRDESVNCDLQEILKELRYYAYAPDLVIRSSLLFVNINQINQCKLIDGKKVKENIVIYRFVSVLGMWFTVVVC